MKTKTVTYHYRGPIELGVGGSYQWRDGYSETTKDGILYPWMTKRECRHDAVVRGGKAVFVKFGRVEKW